jgi:hypothetical protein
MEAWWIDGINVKAGIVEEVKEGQGVYVRTEKGRVFKKAEDSVLMAKPAKVAE